MNMHTGSHSNERGIAMIIALFMMLALSVVGASLMTVSQTETDSSYNYKMMSQARYGAESAIHQATNYLMNTYAPPTGGDLALYDLNSSPVKLLATNQNVVLSATVGYSVYHDQTVKNAYAAAAQGTLDVNAAPINFTATATLLSMRSITDAYSKQPVTIQTWEITGDGTVTGAKSALVEVSSIVERQPVPIYGYAAFATAEGCAALSLKGGATTNSYDSTWALDPVTNTPVIANNWGNVGTNGNLTEVGSNTVAHGSLSTPRQGVGSCSANNITAETLSGGATVDNGLNRLPQKVNYPNPAAIDPPPPLDDQNFKKTLGCPSSPAVDYCAASANGATITPPSAATEVYMGDVTINAQAVLHLHAGTYNVNSFTMEAGSQIVIDDGPVILNVAGLDDSGGELANPITVTGQGIVNTSFKSTDLQIVYGGTGEVKLAGGDMTSAVVYAPNASADITGGADLYGAIIVHELKEAGGAAIHYDRHLQVTMLYPDNYRMSAFTWKSSN
jgi:Tfp pilus assembly protein PilX